MAEEEDMSESMDAQEKKVTLKIVLGIKRTLLITLSVCNNIYYMVCTLVHFTSMSSCFQYFFIFSSQSHDLKWLYHLKIVKIDATSGVEFVTRYWIFLSFLLFYLISCLPIFKTKKSCLVFINCWFGCLI